VFNHPELPLPGAQMGNWVSGPATPVKSIRHRTTTNGTRSICFNKHPYGYFASERRNLK